jgi:hypothetical protein
MSKKVAWSTGKPDKREGSTWFKPGHVQCTAKSKRSQEQCRNTAMDNGKCRMHGGVTNPEAISEGLKGNKNGVVTGSLESVFFTFISDDEEKAILEAAKAATILVMINQELQLITLREHRMMKRIKEWLDKADSNGMIITKVEEERGTAANTRRKTNLRRESRESALDMVNRIEEALTKVQDKKAKLIDMKYQFEKGEGPKDTTGVEKFLKALNGAAKHTWGNEEKPAWLTNVERSDEDETDD